MSERRRSAGRSERVGKLGALRLRPRASKRFVRTWLFVPALLLLSPVLAQSAYACESPVFEWTPQSTGGSACNGHCGYFRTAYAEFFISPDLTHISWHPVGGHRFDFTTATTASGRPYRSGRISQQARTNPGDKWASVQVHVTNCPATRAERQLQLQELEGNSGRSPVWPVAAGLAFAAAAASLGYVWFNQRRGVLVG